MGLDEAVLRNPRTNLRRTEVARNIGVGGLGNNSTYAHCRCGLENARAEYNCTSHAYGRFTLLIPHGGSRGVGRLWNDYNSMQKRRTSSSVTTTIVNGQPVTTYPEHVHVERAVFQLLRPSKQLRIEMEDALNKAMQNATAEKCARNESECELKDGGSTTTASPRVLALHPRVEPEMLRHRCASHMESNLTRVFEWCQHYPNFFDAKINDNDMTRIRQYKFDMVFMAVSKGQILERTNSADNIGIIANQNREAFLHAKEHGLFGGNGAGIPIFVLGTDSAGNVKFPSSTSMSSRDEVEGGNPSSPFVTPESLGVLELVASIINFFTAVRADVFLGVRGSSFSTDVFSVRYYQRNKLARLENYIIGRDGIQQLYGPPPPHSC
ncbi:hypothetical protein ACHAXA_002386 [Cyclostephanos tholiformis]|uniref:Uncharacterized protein n=1 Tax=Cyclostephanos tholiformis TaxID=382380 RepID=A0ABD3RH96_9STRA